jgi:hypothetical protein
MFRNNYDHIARHHTADSERTNHPIPSQAEDQKTRDGA